MAAQAKMQKKSIGELTGTSWEFCHSPISICGSNVSFPSMFPWLLVLKIRRSFCLGSVPLKLMESQVTLFGLGRTSIVLLSRDVKGLSSVSYSLQRIKGTRARLWKLTQTSIPPPMTDLAAGFLGTGSATPGSRLHFFWLLCRKVPHSVLKQHKWSDFKCIKNGQVIIFGLR